MCGASQSAQYPSQPCCFVGCGIGWLWSYSQPQFIQPKMGVGMELGWVMSVLTCDTNPDSATPVLGTQR